MKRSPRAGRREAEPNPETREGCHAKDRRQLLHLALDGVVESPDRWHFPYFDEQMGAAIGAGMASSDALLMGRRSYEEWAAYWPTSTDEPFASQMTGVRKHVVSSTLTSVSWSNCSLVEGDLADSLRRLKAEPGADIAMLGQRHPGQLAAAQRPARRAQPAGPPDRRELGPCLFDEGRPPVRLELLSAETFGSGVQHLRYRPLPAEAEEGGALRRLTARPRAPPAGRGAPAASRQVVRAHPLTDSIAELRPLNDRRSPVDRPAAPLTAASSAVGRCSAAAASPNRGMFP